LTFFWLAKCVGGYRKSQIVLDFLPHTEYSELTTILVFIGTHCAMVVGIATETRVLFQKGYFRVPREEGIRMLKRWTYGVAYVLVAFVVIVAVKVRVEARQTSRPAATANHPNASAFDQPKIETKQQLISQDHTADVLAIEQVWAAYGFFIDSGNGEGAASLYTEDGVIQHFWSDKGSKWEPHGGMGSFQTPYGTTRGGPCVVRGRKEIQAYFGDRRTATPMTGWTHHTSPNLMVKVNDDGKSAVLTTTMLIVSTNDKGASNLTTGAYRVFFKKAPGEGWLITEQYNFADRPRGNPNCGANGPTEGK
jgi:hypothetical protein